MVARLIHFSGKFSAYCMPKKALMALCALVFVALTLPFSAQSRNSEDPDIVLIGGGIMSATLATLLNELDPQLRIDIYERSEALAWESSGTLNNAGTGHAALAEMNYTPEKADGSIDISKAIKINEDFEISKQLWAYLSKNGLGSPEAFINPVPHYSWVRGESNIRFLKKRYEALKKISLFQDMEFSEDPKVLREWMPLLFRGRTSNEPMAATRSFLGTDVDFGRLTQLLFARLQARGSVRTFVAQDVSELKKIASGRWQIKTKNRLTGELKTISTPRVFIGAGGGTLTLLQKSGVKEAEVYGGFPISGAFLLYKGSELSEENFGKIYGQAAVGAPPMSVPHLDTRIIGGKRHLIFGPFAGATTRFLKNGSVWDLMRSLRVNNISIMLQAGAQNLSLVKYLVEQQMQTHEDRMNALREFIPNAKDAEWELLPAGQRVQIIKKEPNQKDVLRFGTEVVSTSDGRLAALLGASPGASTSAAIMLEVIQKMFSTQMQTAQWQETLSEIIPSYGQSLSNDRALLNTTRKRCAEILKLK